METLICLGSSLKNMIKSTKCLPFRVENLALLNCSRPIFFRNIAPGQRYLRERERERERCICSHVAKQCKNNAQQKVTKTFKISWFHPGVRCTSLSAFSNFWMNGTVEFLYLVVFVFNTSYVSFERVFML